MSVKENRSDNGRERAGFARRTTGPKADLNDVRRKNDMRSNKGRERAVASDPPPSQLRETGGKAGRADGVEKTTALARRSRAEGAKPPRLRRGAVETPPVQSVERALSLLEAVARSAEPVPLASLTEVLGIDPSSVFRLANTLKRRGFLANPNGRKHYVLGPAVWRLSRDYDWSRLLISICHEAVKALAMRTGETAHLAVREGREVFFIDHCASGDQASSSPVRPAS
jgi:hypothetical protein